MEYYKNLDLADIEYFCEYDKVIKVEEWVELPNYNGYYQVSDLGRVVCLRKSKPRILAQRENAAGYLRTTLHLNGVRKTKPIHQLVAICFLNHKPCGQELVPNHKDFDKKNNVKYNLEIITSRENSNYKLLKPFSLYAGVDYHKRSKKWRSRITIGRKSIHLGMFDKEIDASIAYNNKLKEITK